MNKLYTLSLGIALMGFSIQASAQRYLTEVFTDAQITTTLDQEYARNISVLPAVLGTGFPDTVGLRADIYYPSIAADTASERPLIIYIPTGNFLPPVVNGSPNGSRKDSSAINIAKQLARRGYVCAVIEYRQGWNPTSTDQVVRTGTILNAAFRGQQDSKAAVRYFRADRATANAYKIDPNRVALIGEGTGGYIAMAHAFLDAPGKIGRLPGLGGTKFLRTQNPDTSVVDTNRVGNFDGINNIPLNLSGLLATGNLLYVNGNVANNPTYSSTVNFVINLGGALGDSSWIDRGQIPSIAIQAVRDPNAPYFLGDVVVPTVPPSIVIPWAAGAGYTVERANSFGNNNSFSTRIYDDAITAAVEAQYGQSIAFAGSTINVGTGKGLLPFILTENPIFANNHGSPWQFWNSNQPTATAAVPNGGGATAHQAASQSNPFMATSNEVGRSTALTYIDTIQAYINPRIVCALNLAECSLFDAESISDVASAATLVTAFPNPSTGDVTIRSKAGAGQLNAIRMFDITGREVLAQSGLNSATYQISRNTLPSGIYLVQVTTEKGRGTVKLILE